MVSKSISKKQQAKKDLINYWRDVAERAVKVFLFAYFARWFEAGREFDVLFTRDNFEAGVIGLAASLAWNLGAKNIGDKDSASVLTT